MRIIISLFGLFSSFLTAQALESETPNCENLYRAAYMEYSKTQKSSLNDARIIYQIYFDYRNDLSDAYVAAKPIFQAVGIVEENEVLALEEISSQMKSGGLCVDGKTKSIPQVIEYLRTRNI